MYNLGNMTNYDLTGLSRTDMPRLGPCLLIVNSDRNHGTGSTRGTQTHAGTAAADKLQQL